MDQLGYRDRTVVLTGGSSGMGEAAVRILGDLGARVHVVDIKEPSVPHATFHATDLADPDLGEDFFASYPCPTLGRPATAEEQAWPLVLLNSPLNAVVSGTVLYTDQGFSGGALTGSLDLTPLLTRLEA